MGVNIPLKNFSEIFPMENKSIIEKRKKGVFYTPKILADYLIEPLIDGSDVSIIDPAYGDGALLLSAESIFKKKVINNSKLKLFGCDINPVNGLLKHLPQANLVKSDFFEFDSPVMHDLILTNPPYIRHQNQDAELIKKYRSSHSELKLISKQADLWAYFLIRSSSFLKKGGSIGAILPWSFLQAEYAIKIRIWLIENFGEIKCLALNNEYFESTQERVVLIWLKNFGNKCQSLKYAQAKDIESKIKFVSIHKESWSLSSIANNTNNELEKLLTRYKTELGYKEFGEYAIIRIGVVTGADKFFIKDVNEIAELGVEDSKLMPIITTTRELPEYLKGNANFLKRLICLSNDDEIIFRDFINEGISKEYNIRSHSRLRTPWYSVGTGEIPDAFFPYRVAKMPYMVINNLRVQSTNSVHRIYFKGLSEIQQRWIQISFLSIYSQLSIETNAKTYGRGMLKVEPGLLKKALVFVSDNNNVEEIYLKIKNLLINGNKEEAIRIATGFINHELNVPTELITISENIWDKIQNSKRTHFEN